MHKRKEKRERMTSGDRDSQKENKNSNKNIEPKAVLYVPYTPNSELAKELRKVEENEGGREGRGPVEEDIGQNQSLGRDRLPARGLPKVPNKTGNRRGERQDMLKEKHPL